MKNTTLGVHHTFHIYFIIPYSFTSNHISIQRFYSNKSRQNESHNYCSAYKAKGKRVERFLGEDICECWNIVVKPFDNFQVPTIFLWHYAELFYCLWITILAYFTLHIVLNSTSASRLSSRPRQTFSFLISSV